MGFDRNNGYAVKNMELVAWIELDGFELDWEFSSSPLDHHQVSVQEEIYRKFRDDPDEALLFLGLLDHGVWVSDSVRFLRDIAGVFVRLLSRNPDVELLRERVVVELDEVDTERILRNAPYMNGTEYLTPQWLGHVWRQLNEAFSRTMMAYRGSVADFLASQSSDVHVVGKVFFHLVENKKGDYPFAFMATYSSGLTAGGKSKHLPLKNALVEYMENRDKLLELLSTVNRAAEKSRLISELVESGEVFHPIGFNSRDAYAFLKEIPLYEESGILCRVPNWWRAKSNSLRLSITLGNEQPSRLGLDAIVDFNAQVSMGDEAVTIEELRNLLSEAEGLAFIKGKWVEVDHQKLNEILQAYEQAQKLMNTGMTMMEAMRFQLSDATVVDLPKDANEIEITNGEWLDAVISKLVHPTELEAVSGGENFNASLRPYQQTGLTWLLTMKSLGLGACLADDMGLGKTIQIIALLNYIRSQKSEKTLLLIPASLIGNWMNELGKFASSLKYYVLHPSENKIETNVDARLLDGHDLVITTYGMLTKINWLHEVHWHMLILDEAQAIKNPGTKQTRAVKQLKSNYRIAMTGTPIENRLSDLWSLFDFLNKGLLGNAKEFAEFTKRLKEHQEGYARLKKVVNPFILRRLKTDKEIITDLPDKIEMKTFTTLTKRQAALYRALVEEVQRKLEATDRGIERKGLVLSSLLKLKQICNHPDQYLGQSMFSAEESGKFARLRELCETIYEKRERVLVFTQFKEITNPLREFLETVFHHDGLVLHGETSVAKRKQIVDKFQGHEYVPFMVLSIKAGGVGLNLTAANHVIHFDRWWNPAVENQATDRAFRIGQHKNVLVHKFITKGTIEEKIDLLIEEKTRLASEIVPDAQESWLTEMDNQQLMDLFKLSL